MKDWQTLSNVKWDCKYHIVFVTKYRHKTIYKDSPPLNTHRREKATNFKMYTLDKSLGTS
ncbi:transposase [Desulfobacter curvatus]|uniref:transposase n=1 Tax=Desulfobacter curvatus TaxID=2290 RepID=UPI00036A417A